MLRNTPAATFHGRIQRGTGVRTPTPQKKSQKLRIFLAKLVQIPWKIQKVQSQNSMLGHHWHASEMPFKWRFAGVPIMACCILPPLINKKKVLSSWTPSDKTFCICACIHYSENHARTHIDLGLFYLPAAH